MTSKNLTSLNHQIIDAIKYWRKWFLPAVYDVKGKYKRTKLGALWTVLSSLITLSIMAVVWSYVFNESASSFIPYLFNGFLIFFLFNNSVVSSCQLFTVIFKEIYLNIPILPLSLILRNYFKNLITYAHYLIIIIPLYFLTVEFNIINIFLFLFGILIFSINTILFCFLCSVIVTRFRDFEPLIISVLSAATLITPIIWKKEMLGDKMNWVYLNPLSFMIEIVRDPMLGNTPEIIVYTYNLFLFIFLYIIIYFTLKFKGNRIVFWI